MAQQSEPVAVEREPRLVPKQASSTPIASSPTPSPAPGQEDSSIAAEMGIGPNQARSAMTSNNSQPAHRHPSPSSSNRSPSRQPQRRGNIAASLQGHPTEQFQNGNGSISSSKASAVGGAGSTLANTKLTKRQSEALSRVPCKFFRSANGCSAGDACPFAHVQPGSGPGVEGAIGGAGGSSGGTGAKSVCEFFIKGNCRFGHKCALAHVREGEPMSMDRKNKKAAQQGQKGAKGGAQQQSMNPQQSKDRSSELPNHQQQQQQQFQTLQHQRFMQHLNSLPIHEQHQFHVQYLQHQQQQQQQQAQPSLAHLAPPSDWPSAYPPNGNLPPREDFSFGLPDDMQPPPPGTGTASGIAQSLNGGADPTHRAGSISAASQHAHLIGSPPSTRAFGSSPFGQSVFFSGSQESEGGAGPFARSVGSGVGAQLTSKSLAAARNGSFSGSSLRPRIGRLHDGYGHVGGSSSLEDEAEELEDGDEDHYEEDFLPSSLSDLLTPAELERRRRSAAASQSMPAHVAEGSGGFGSGLADFGRRAAAGIASSSRQGEVPIAEADEPGDFNFEKRSTHAPGQSLPHGLAAGLSRLHLAAASGQERLSTGGAERGVGLTIPSTSSATRQSHNGQHLSVGLGASPRVGAELGRTPPRYEFGPVGSPARRALVGNGNDKAAAAPSTSLDDYGLGPTAPSSVLPHRPGPLSSRLSAAFSFDGRGNSYSQSPTAGVAGTSNSPAKHGGHMGSYASAAGGNSGNAQGHLHPGSAKSPAFAPGMGQRSSLSTTSISASSPLALPPSNGEDGDEEVGVFELE